MLRNIRAGWAHRISGSMRARMTLWFALLIAFFMLFLSSAYLLYARRELENHFAASLDRIAPESAAIAKSGTSLDSLRAAIQAHNASVAQSGAISEGVEAWIVDSSGKPSWYFGPGRGDHNDDGDEDGRRGGGGGRRGRGGGGRRPPLLPGLNRPFVPPLDDTGGWRSREVKWGNQRLLLGLPWRRAQAELRAQSVALVALSLLVTAAAAFGAWILVGKTLRPIGALAEQAHHNAQSPMELMERRAPLQPTSRDEEMTSLVSTLNEMLDNVREAALSKERFHTSASHELRTPLQALAGHLGVALSRERNAAEYRGALEEAARQTTRLSKLTGDLLLLNRLQTAATAPHTEEIDVTEICDIALQRAEKTIETRHLKVADSFESLCIEAAPSHVEILLGNLVENAAKYARAGGTIGVEVKASPPTVRVWNECDEAQLRELEGESTRLFEPFYRPDAARTGETGGNGLGLAICQSIAQTNGWELSIETTDSLFAVEVRF
ncbi:HAMP domain-containing protein [bacterium]|nr:MAG: HAMP domain-containing protein [bacterium]